MLCHKHARARVLPSYDARLTAGSQEEEALQEFEGERVLVVAHAVHLQSALVVDVHIPEQHSAWMRVCEHADMFVQHSQQRDA
jgi:hypothetical protein